ncbi:alpha-L-iduronidase isoform X2 [Bacillus rossius redtenbacheri]|uniref:alpha-L-iduronidase isoform X2 n=1 Tax=Bacillus rossius redtenbacheri TaxID=93214 RepID=UPI002FDCB62C
MLRATWFSLLAPRALAMWFSLLAAGALAAGATMLRVTWFSLLAPRALAMWFSLLAAGALAAGATMLRATWFSLLAPGSLAAGATMLRATWFSLLAPGSLAMWFSLLAAGALAIWFSLLAPGSLAAGATMLRATWFSLLAPGSLAMWFSLLAAGALAAGASPLSLEVDAGGPPAAELRRFWTSTGLSPTSGRRAAAEFLLSRDEQLNLALIGSLPNAAITHVRIHWLLDLVSVAGNADNGDLRFDFTFLDRLLDFLHLFGLSPGFEIMGNPSEHFSNFNNETTSLEWQKMVQTLAERYIDRYGIENVSKWRFELWNEPDLAMYNILNFTLQGYLSYAGATWRGLRAASPRLGLAGPAGLFKARARHPLCWGLLDLCAAQPRRCPLDLLSFHRKGGGSEDSVLRGGVRLALRLRSAYPALALLPLANDEADPLTGWWRGARWRGDSRYAAMVARGVARHQDYAVRRLGLPFQLVSNDNGFLSSYPLVFSQRTLAARFQMNNTSPPHSQFFLKPVYVVMALLSLLGDAQLSVDVSPPDDRLAVLATRGGAGGDWSVATLLVFSNNTQAGGAGTNVTVSLRHLPSAGARYVLLQLGSRPGPAEAWRRAGAPRYPDPALRRRMRSAQGPTEIAAGEAGSSLHLGVQLSLPGVALLQLCSIPTLPPAQMCTEIRGGILAAGGATSLQSTEPRPSILTVLPPRGATVAISERGRSCGRGVQSAGSGHVEQAWRVLQAPPVPWYEQPGPDSRQLALWQIIFRQPCFPFTFPVIPKHHKIFTNSSVFIFSFNTEHNANKY